MPTLVNFGRVVLLTNRMYRHAECTNGSPSACRQNLNWATSLLNRPNPLQAPSSLVSSHTALHYTHSPPTPLPTTAPTHTPLQPLATLEPPPPTFSTTKPTPTQRHDKKARLSQFARLHVRRLPPPRPRLRRPSPSCQPKTGATLHIESGTDERMLARVPLKQKPRHRAR